jgi:hypothetical protein
VIGLCAITLAVTILGTLVFSWAEHTIWFVLGVGKSIIIAKLVANHLQ